MYYTLTTETISFVLEGAEQVTALRAKVSVNKADILSIKWYDSFNEWPAWHMRMPGSYLPKWVMAGSYWGDMDWDFVLAKKPRGMIKPLLHNVLVIMTNKERYRRIIIQTTKDNYNEIVSWYKQGVAS